MACPAKIVELKHLLLMSTVCASLEVHLLGKCYSMQPIKQRLGGHYLGFRLEDVRSLRSGHHLKLIISSLAFDRS